MRASLGFTFSALVLAAACAFGDFEKVDSAASSGGRAATGGAANQAGAGGRAEGGAAGSDVSGGAAGQPNSSGGVLGAGGAITQTSGGISGAGGGVSSGGAGSAQAGASGTSGAGGSGGDEGVSGAGGDGGASGAGGSGSVDRCAAVNTCTPADGCCPSACNANNDSDCAPRCGNSVVEASETCDLPSTCPTSCAATTACYTESSSGSALTCNFSCKRSFTPCACTRANGCIASAEGAVTTSTIPTPAAAGSIDLVLDGNDATSFGVSTSSSATGASVSMKATATIKLTAPIVVNSLRLVAKAAGGGGGQSGGGGGGDALKAELHHANGSITVVHDFSESGSVSMAGINSENTDITLQGPWSDVTSVVVQVSASGGGSMAASGNANLHEIAITGTWVQ